MPKFSLEIEFEEDEDDVEKIKINGQEIPPNDYKQSMAGKKVVDTLVILEGSRCVWRRGRLYCA